RRAGPVPDGHRRGRSTGRGHRRGATPPAPPEPREGLAPPRERATGKGLPTPETSKTSPPKNRSNIPTHRLRTRRRRRRPGGWPPARGQWGRDSPILGGVTGGTARGGGTVSPMSRGGLGGIAPPEAVWQIFGN